MPTYSTMTGALRIAITVLSLSVKFAAAVALTSILASVFSSQFVMAGLTDLGACFTAGQLLPMDLPAGHHKVDFEKHRHVVKRTVRHRNDIRGLSRLDRTDFRLHTEDSGCVDRR